MKKIYGFAALCAAMTLASCSNENEPNGVIAGEGDSVSNAYLAINMSAPADDTRAAVDAVDGLPKGEVKDSEYAVKNVQFAIFNEAKHLMVITEAYEDLGWGNSSDPDVDKQSSKKVLEIKQSDIDKVGYVMAIVNTPDLTTMGFTTGATAGSTIEEVSSKLGDYKTITVGEKDYLVMSNSAYVGKETIDNAEVDYKTYATSFRGHVYSSIGLATDDPVNIYVERVAARVDLTNARDSKENTVTIANATVDGKSADLTVDITGVDFIYAAKKSTLVKGIDNIATDIAAADWYKGTHRTHWADAASLNWYAEDDANASSSDYQRATYTSANGNSAVGTTTRSFYLHENTTAKPTYVVITGKILLGGEQTEIYQLWNDGKYYTKEGAIKEISGYLTANGYHYYLDNDDVTSTKSVDPSTLDIVASTSTDYEGYIAVPTTVKDEAGNTLKLCKDKVAVDVSKAKDGMLTFAEDIYKTLVYGGGNTYYYCPIAPEAQGSKEGLVRNHIYDIDFGTIGGLGVPLFDPTSELLPKDPTTNQDKDPKWYFNATINILKWKTYGQEMNFTTPTK